MTELLGSDNTEEVYRTLMQLTRPEDHGRITLEYPGYIDIQVGPLTFGFWSDDEFALHVKHIGETLVVVPRSHIWGPTYSALSVALYIMTSCEFSLRPNLGTS